MLQILNALFRLRRRLSGADAAPADHLGGEIAVSETGHAFWYGWGTGTGNLAAASHLLFRSDGTALWHDVLGAGAGSAAAPSIRITSDPDTGLFGAGANVLGFSAGGVARALLSSAAFQIDVPVTGSAVAASTTDATAGRLARFFAANGILGLGATHAPLLANLDSLATVAGLYSFNLNSGSTGTSPGFNVGALIVVAGGANTADAQAPQQIAVQRIAGAGAVAVRTSTGGAWGAWRTVSMTGHTHTASEISDSTAAGRAILMAADAAAQRTALVLGTAATATVTTSATDTTAGRLLRVGDGGLLLTGNASLLADIDATNTASGFHRVDATTAGTFPSGGAVAGTLQIMRQGVAAQSQVLIVAASAGGGRAGQMYSRVYNATGAAWLDWFPILRALSGPTASRPTGSWRFAGLQYFDTDLGVLIVWTGSAWVSPAGWASV